MSLDQTILAVDPGRTSGVAVVKQGDKPELIFCDVIKYSQFFAADLLRLIRIYKPDLIVYESWDNIGVKVDINSSWPNMVIGAIQAVAVTAALPITGYAASKWQREFARNGELLPEPEKVQRQAQKIANALAARGIWPAERLRMIPRGDWPHVIDACGLGLYALTALKMEVQHGSR